VRFDWDRDKEAVNVAKHGVDFNEAQSAFADPLLVLAADKGHLSGRDHSHYRRRLLAKRQKNL